MKTIVCLESDNEDENFVEKSDENGLIEKNISDSNNDGDTNILPDKLPDSETYIIMIDNEGLVFVPGENRAF